MVGGTGFSPKPPCNTPERRRASVCPGFLCELRYLGLRCALLSLLLNHCTTTSKGPNVTQLHVSSHLFWALCLVAGVTAEPSVLWEEANCSTH